MPGPTANRSATRVVGFDFLAFRNRRDGAMRKCLRCGEVEGITRDHVVPRVQLRLALGQDEYARFCAKVRKINIQDLCGPCNNAKGDRTAEYRTDERAEMLLEYLDEFGLLDKINFEEFE